MYLEQNTHSITLDIHASTVERLPHLFVSRHTLHFIIQQNEQQKKVLTVALSIFFGNKHGWEKQHKDVV